MVQRQNSKGSDFEDGQRKNGCKGDQRLVRSNLRGKNQEENFSKSHLHMNLPSCKLSKMRTCICMSNHMSYFMCLAYIVRYWAFSTSGCALYTLQYCMEEYSGFPGDLGVKESTPMQDVGSILEWGRLPWRRKWQLTRYSCLRKFHRQRCLVGSLGYHESDTT